VGARVMMKAYVKVRRTVTDSVGVRVSLGLGSRSTFVKLVIYIKINISIDLMEL
jgi:hypothetical protein